MILTNAEAQIDNEIKDFYNIAVLVDADNVPWHVIPSIINELSKYGNVSIKRAYGNWTKDELANWKDIILSYAMQAVQQFDVAKGGNATDISLVVDAMDLMYQKNIDLFAIVASDSDYCPLASRLRAENKIVYGFGEKKSPPSFQNACSKFLFLENYIDTDKTKKQDRKGNELKGDTKLINLLRGAVDSVADEEGWAYLSQVGVIIKNQASFDPRNYGYSTLRKLFDAIDLFQVDVSEGSAVMVRDGRKK